MENHHNSQDNYMTTILSVFFAALSWFIENADKVLSRTAVLVAIVAGIMAFVNHYYSIKANKAKIKKYENEDN